MTVFSIMCSRHFHSGVSEVPTSKYPKTTKCMTCGKRAKVEAEDMPAEGFEV